MRMIHSLVTAKVDNDRWPVVAKAIDFASAVNACPSGILVTDPTEQDNPIVFVNSAFTELTGYSSAEAIGRNCRFLQGPDTDRKVVSDIRDAPAISIEPP